MIKSVLSLLILASAVLSTCARTFESATADASVSAVIPSPNQFDDEYVTDIQRTRPSATATSFAPRQFEPQQAAPSNEASVPVYASPFARAERASAFAPIFDRQESSHAPPNYAPRPLASSSSAASTNDLKASASYGHHHHGGHHGGYDHSGWLDMGAWTGGKGSFGWYADYPVGGKHHYGYGRK